MRAFEGRRGLVFGIANDHSIAWAITQQLHAAGAQMGFTHLPDKDPGRPRMERRVRQLVEPFARFIQPCDVGNDEDLDSVFATARQTFRQLDFVLHSIAYAPIADLRGPTMDVSRDGFRTAMEISVYSLLAIAGRARVLLAPGGSILTLTYLGGERVIPGYNLMGVCKAALERAVAYLASELGPSGIRVNSLSAGPVRTLSASAVGDFDQMIEAYNAMSPMRKNIEPEDVGKTGLFLLSDMSSGITGENVHVDCGFHVMGAPPPERALGWFSEENRRRLGDLEDGVDRLKQDSRRDLAPAPKPTHDAP